MNLRRLLFLKLTTGTSSYMTCLCVWMCGYGEITTSCGALQCNCYLIIIIIFCNCVFSLKKTSFLHLLMYGCLVSSVVQLMTQSTSCQLNHHVSFSFLKTFFQKKIYSQLTRTTLVKSIYFIYICSKLKLAVWLCSGSSLPFYRHTWKALGREFNRKPPIVYRTEQALK